MKKILSRQTRGILLASCISLTFENSFDYLKTALANEAEILQKHILISRCDFDLIFYL